MLTVRFWGVRGSLPTPGPATVKLGGNTLCVEINADGHLIVIDAGTGIAELGRHLLRGGNPVAASLFFTHFHHDHVQGFPFFGPAALPTTTLTIYSERKGTRGAEDLLREVMAPPYFPLPMSAFKAKMSFEDLGDHETIQVAPHVTVTSGRLNHPNGGIGYRVEVTGNGKKRVYAHCADTEHLAEPDPNVIALAKDADVMVYDSAYTPEEYEKRKGWGHSTWQEAARIAKLAGVKQLVLFHHDPMHSDKDMVGILALTKKEFKSTILAQEKRLLTLKL